MKKIPEYKDPRIEHHYPSRTKHEIFQQYFQLAAHTKGADYTMETLPEADIMRKNNTKVEFISFVEGKSTTNIIEKIKGE